MAENRDDATEPAASAAGSGAPKAAGDTPLPVETPGMGLVADGAASDKRSGPFLPITVERMTQDETFAAQAEAISAEAAETMAEEPPAASRRRWLSHLPLAAGIALALAIGGLAGAVATAGLSGQSVAVTEAAEANQALRASVAQLGSELAALKGGVTSAQRSTSAQFGKLTERLDRAEKAQAEPAAKLAKIQESIDRLDRRQQQAVAAPASDVTGSVTPKQPKEEARPPVAEGWRLRDFYAGRAIVESRNGTLFEVGPGSTLPGLGRVEGIKRENGRIVVVARNGIITASLESRRPPVGLPYRY